MMITVMITIPTSDSWTSYFQTDNDNDNNIITIIIIIIIIITIIMNSLLKNKKITNMFN